MRLVAYALLLLTVACDFGTPHPGNLDERAHVFYEKQEFYLGHPETAVFVEGGYSSEKFSFVLRPVGANLVIPKYYLVAVTHQFQPWAKQIHDVASIVASLPDFAPRTKENSDLLMTNRTPDRLSITLGSIADDAPSEEYRKAVLNGTLVLDNRRSSVDVPVYRKSFDTAGTEPFFALPDPSKIKSPLGNDIVIACLPAERAATGSAHPVDQCTVQIALPPSYFGNASAAKFPGGPGVRLSYQFNEKYLPTWLALHARVIAFVRGFIGVHD